jgi:prolycopene isomerase
MSVIDEYFTDPLLKLALSVYWTYLGIPPRLLAFTDYAGLYFAYMEFKPYHFKGGSQALSSAIIDSFLSNGGTVRFNCAVEKIIIKDNTVKAVRTEHGDEITAKFVVSNASAISTFVDMIDSENLPASVLKDISGSTVSTSFMTIYAGLDCEPGDVGITETTNFMCATTDIERDFAMAKTLDCSESSLILSCYNKSDPDFSPEGTSQVAIVAMKYAEPWLRVSPAEYYREKYRCADDMLKRVERHFPGFRKNIEEIEVATPLTHIRYLGHPGGSPYGFDNYLKDSTMFISPKPPINGLYCAGAWYGQPGYQPTLTSGTTAARAILKEMRA